MAIPSWPSDLPQRPSQQGYSVGFGDGRLMTEMDAGPPKMRRRYTSTVKPVAMSFVGDANAVARFERFWDIDLKGGSLPFTIVNPIMHGMKLVTETGTTVTDELGNPILVAAYDLALMGKSPPQVTPVGGLDYRISCTLTKLPV